MCMVTCWHIWKSRCRVTFAGKMPQSGVVIMEIRTTIDELRQLPTQQIPEPVNREDGRWTTPNPRTVRINCDASWCAQTGMGVITQNSDGNVVGGCNRRNRGDGAEMMAEMTIHAGIWLALGKGWTEVEIELDSKVMIEQIKGGAPHWWIRALLVNISLCASQLERVSWKTILRAANECVNWVAKQTRMSVSLND